MQVIAGAAPLTRSDRIAVARSALTSVLLVLAGLLIGWLCVATPLISTLVPSGRPTAVQTATGIVAWGFAILVPAMFLLIGVARIAATIEALASLRPRAATAKLTRSLGPDHMAATDILLPGGRRVHELVLGPFGVLVIAPVPPRNVSRHIGSRWEVRNHRGRWVPIEAPLDRATRDAERVRGWLASDDRDFLVRVYAVVVTDDPEIERTPACAVVTPAQLAGWIMALPPQRGLTEDRRERLAEHVRSVAAAS